MLTIHKASAGSGKTYTLTYSYIKLLLGKKDEAGHYSLSTERRRHRAILAITFTNKATDEMKRRIVHQLALLAGIGSESSPYEDDLCRELSTDTRRLRKQALEALHDLLCDFGNFNVSTIDSFFQTVLRTFSREANITGNYDVELNDKYIITVGISEMLSSVNRASAVEHSDNTRLTALMMWLRQYMRHKISEGNAFNIFNRKSKLVADLISFVQSVFNETYKLNSAAINAYLDDMSRTIGFTRRLSTLIDSMVPELTLRVKEVYPALEAGGVFDMMSKANAANFAAWNEGDLDKITPGCRAAIDNPDKRYKKGQYPGNSLDAMAWELAADVHKSIADRALLVKIKGSIYNLGLIGEIRRHAESFQNENNSILLSDTNDILRSIISEEEAPFIYERLGVRLRHFLIDEFQDTSRLQWCNLSPLVSESLSTANDNLIIGDEKQSIYRFRNSDPDLLVKDVPAEFDGDITLRGNRPEENTNWRSASEIVRFNNTVFTFMASAKGLSDIYSNVVQRIAAGNRQGYVMATPYKEVEDSLDIMAREIARQLKSGYSQGDIAILVSTKNNGSAVISYLLEQKKIDPDLAGLQIMSEDSLAISSSPAVGTIVSVLSYLDSRRSISKCTTDSDEAPSHLPVATIQSRYNYFLSRGHDRIEAIRLAFSDDTSAEELATDTTGMNCINLPSIVERIISRFVTDDTLERENIYISGFQDIVSDFCEHREGDLHSFLQWWDSFGKDNCQLAIPSSVNAVRVMTIHKSKGLEFPCVHIPIVDWPFLNAKNTEWFSTRDTDGRPFGIFTSFPEEELPPFIPLNTSRHLENSDFGPQYRQFAIKECVDIMNKTYVAFTRAVNELIIGYKTPGENADSTEASVHCLLCDTLVSASRQWVDSQGEKGTLMLPLAESTDSEGAFIYGSPTVKNRDDGKDTGSLEMPTYKALDNENIWELSRIEELEEMSLPRQKGIIMHSIMSGVRTPADINRAVRRQAIRGHIADDETGSYTDLLSRAVADPRVEPWFSGFRRLLNERAFITRDTARDKLNRYRPDRVVWTASGSIDVIDYKFGEEEPGKYIRQVKGYTAALRKMYPGVTVRGFLWYPLQSRITPVQ